MAQGVPVIQGETELRGLEGKTGGTVVKIPVLSLSTIWLMSAIFPGLSTPSLYIALAWGATRATP